MRNLSIPILWACFAPLAGHAQQLVPNPSFEAFTACPTFASMLANAEPWFNPTAGTPELYHACAGTGTFAGVPANSSGGYQQPRTGQGFAGIYTFRTGIAGFREYIAVPLLAPLEAGRCYRFTMHVNMPNDFDLACDAIGVHFSNGALITGNPYVLPVPAHIEHPAGQLITDTVAWIPVSGVYTATGGEDHLTIGNFRSDAQTQTALINPGPWYQDQAYLLIDDVSLEPVVDDLDLGPDTTVCSNSPYVLDATVAGATAVLWNDGVTTPVRAVSTSGTYAVAVHVGACVFTDTVVVTLAPLPALELGGDRLLCAGLTLVLEATADGGSAVVWQDGSIGASLTVHGPGLYHATATNSCGSVSDTVRVVADACPEAIYLPNAFTPNGDGINDLFAPVYDARLWRLAYRIFDRWGRLCFAADDGTPWTAESVPDGLYTVQVTAISHTKPAADRLLLGHVALLR